MQKVHPQLGPVPMETESFLSQGSSIGSQNLLTLPQNSNAQDGKSQGVFLTKLEE
jgi:hypothetical protein